MSASSDGVSLSGHWASGSSARRDEKKVQAVEEASAMGEQRLSFFLELSNALRRSVDFGGTLDSVKAAISPRGGHASISHEALSPKSPKVSGIVPVVQPPPPAAAAAAAFAAAAEFIDIMDRNAAKKRLLAMAAARKGRRQRTEKLGQAFASGMRGGIVDDVRSSYSAAEEHLHLVERATSPIPAATALDGGMDDSFISEDYYFDERLSTSCPASPLLLLSNQRADTRVRGVDDIDESVTSTPLFVRDGGDASESVLVRGAVTTERKRRRKKNKSLLRLHRRQVWSRNLQVGQENIRGSTDNANATLESGENEDEDSDVWAEAHEDGSHQIDSDDREDDNEDDDDDDYDDNGEDEQGIRLQVHEEGSGDDSHEMSGGENERSCGIQNSGDAFLVHGGKLDDMLDTNVSCTTPVKSMVTPSPSCTTSIVSLPELPHARGVAVDDDCDGKKDDEHSPQSVVSKAVSRERRSSSVTAATIAGIEEPEQKFSERVAGRSISDDDDENDDDGRADNEDCGRGNTTVYFDAEDDQVIFEHDDDEESREVGPEMEEEEGHVTLDCQGKSDESTVRNDDVRSSTSVEVEVEERYRLTQDGSGNTSPMKGIGIVESTRDAACDHDSARDIVSCPGIIHAEPPYSTLHLEQRCNDDSRDTSVDEKKSATDHRTESSDENESLSSLSFAVPPVPLQDLDEISVASYDSEGTKDDHKADDDNYDDDIDDLEELLELRPNVSDNIREDDDATSDDDVIASVSTTAEDLEGDSNQQGTVAMEEEEDKRAMLNDESKIIEAEEKISSVAENEAAVPQQHTRFHDANQKLEELYQELMRSYNDYQRHSGAEQLDAIMNPSVREHADGSHDGSEHSGLRHRNVSFPVASIDDAGAKALRNDCVQEEQEEDEDGDFQIQVGESFHDRFDNGDRKRDIESNPSVGAVIDETHGTKNSEMTFDACGDLHMHLSDSQEHIHQQLRRLESKTIIIDTDATSMSPHETSDDNAPVIEKTQAVDEAAATFECTQQHKSNASVLLPSEEEEEEEDISQARKRDGDDHIEDGSSPCLMSDSIEKCPRLITDIECSGSNDTATHTHDAAITDDTGGLSPDKLEAEMDELVNKYKLRDIHPRRSSSGTMAQTGSVTERLTDGVDATTSIERTVKKETTATQETQTQDARIDQRDVNITTIRQDQHEMTLTRASPKKARIGLFRRRVNYASPHAKVRARDRHHRADLLKEELKEALRTEINNMAVGTRRSQDSRSHVSTAHRDMDETSPSATMTASGTSSATTAMPASLDDFLSMKVTPSLLEQRRRNRPGHDTHSLKVPGPSRSGAGPATLPVEHSTSIVERALAIQHRRDRKLKEEMERLRLEAMRIEELSRARQRAATAIQRQWRKSRRDTGPLFQRKDARIDRGGAASAGEGGEDTTSLAYSRRHGTRRRGDPGRKRAASDCELPSTSSMIAKIEIRELESVLPPTREVVVSRTTNTDDVGSGTPRKGESRPPVPSSSSSPMELKENISDTANVDSPQQGGGAAGAKIDSGAVTYDGDTRTCSHAYTTADPVDSKKESSTRVSASNKVQLALQRLQRHGRNRAAPFDQPTASTSVVTTANKDNIMTTSLSPPPSSPPPPPVTHRERFVSIISQRPLDISKRKSMPDDLHGEGTTNDEMQDSTPSDERKPPRPQKYLKKRARNTYSALPRAHGRVIDYSRVKPRVDCHLNRSAVYYSPGYHQLDQRRTKQIQQQQQQQQQQESRQQRHQDQQDQYVSRSGRQSSSIRRSGLVFKTPDVDVFEGRHRRAAALAASASSSSIGRRPRTVRFERSPDWSQTPSRYLDWTSIDVQPDDTTSMPALSSSSLRARGLRASTGSLPIGPRWRF